MKNNKKFIAIAVAALMVGLVAIAGFNGTLAYLFDGKNVNNKFNPALVNIAVVEKNGPIEGGVVDYGAAETKTVTIQNLNEPDGMAVDCYIRARVVPMVVNDATGAVVAMDISAAVAGKITSQNWRSVEGGDPLMCYFKDAVAPGKSTDELLSKFDPNSIKDIPAGCHLEIQIIADAVQADPDAAAAAGWPASMIPDAATN